MFAFGLPLPALPVSAQTPAAQPQAARQRTAADGLTVEYSEQETSLATRRTLFRGGIKAWYDVTRLEAEELEIDQASRRGWARGKVRIFDPEGVLECTELEFRWFAEGEPKPGPDVVLGSAKSVEVRAGNVWLKGSRLEIRDGLWTIEDAEGSLTQRQSPEYKITARRVSLVPGKSGVAEHIYLRTLGLKIGPLPRYSFNLDQRVDSRFTLPNYARDDQGRFGLAWSIVRPLSGQSVLRGSWSTFPGQAGALNLSYAYSPLAGERTRAKIATPSELTERFDDGWMDNIGVIGPDKEQDDFRVIRRNFMVQTDWNSGISARETGPVLITRPLDVSFEEGRPLGAFGSRVTTRLQGVRQQRDEPYRVRSVAQGTLSAPTYDLGGGLGFRSRIDGFATASTETLYGWLRGQAGLVYQPGNSLRLGAAYVVGRDFGTPDFDFDRLYSDHAAHLRVDFFSGPFTVRYLWKYDFSRKKIYDREYELAYVAGAFEPFIQYRQFPGQYQWGLRFRMDNLVNRLVTRDTKRTK